MLPFRLAYFFQRGFRKRAPLVVLSPDILNMNTLDISIIAVVAIAAVRGLFRGVIKELASIAAILLGGWFAYRYHADVAALLGTAIPSPVSRLLSFLLLMLLAGLASHILGNLVEKVVKLALMGWVNRLGGIMFGAFEGAVLLSMFFYAVTSLPFKLQFKDEVKSHYGASMLAGFGSILLDRAKSMGPPSQ